MPKTKKAKQQLTKWLYLAVGVLVALSAVALYNVRRADEPAGKRAVNVSLGAMEYAFADDKAVKRDDAATDRLRAFLEQAAQKDIELGCQSTYYNVVRYTKDESQLLLAYGCDYPGARMFAVKSGAVWRLLSPTNQFDDLGTPSCDHIAEYSISAEIAPVCVKGLGSSSGQVRYQAR